MLPPCSSQSEALPQQFWNVHSFPLLVFQVHGVSIKTPLSIVYQSSGWLRSRLLPRSCDVYCMWEMRSPVPLQSLDLRGCLPLCPDPMDQELPAYWFSVKGESVQSTHRVERTPGDPREHSRLSGLGCSTISPLQPASVFRSRTFQLLEHFMCSKGLCLSLTKDIAQTSS